MWRSVVEPGSSPSLRVAPPRALQINERLRHEILDHLRSSLPNEGCGLLGVERQPDETAVATHFYPGTNRDASPTRYTMDPAEVLAAFRDLAAHGWSLGAIVHSHPATPATPSPTDLREAFYPEALMLIVSFVVDPPVMRAWCAQPPPAIVDAYDVPIIGSNCPEGN